MKQTIIYRSSFVLLLALCSCFDKEAFWNSERLGKLLIMPESIDFGLGTGTGTGTGTMPTACSSAVPVNLNSVKAASIDQTYETDYYKITVTFRGLLDTYTSSSLDTAGALLDSNCNTLISDSGAGLNFQLPKRLNPGTYYISVSSYNIGSYNLHIEFMEPSTSPITGLNFRVKDAEYSRQLDKIIMISANTNELIIYDPELNTSATVALNYPPLAVSVSPDGQTAAVGHSGFVSHVDLVSKVLLNTFSITATAATGDIVLGGNGYAYIFPNDDLIYFANQIHSLNLTSGSETQSARIIERTGNRAKLHPSGSFIYLANYYYSSSILEKFDISGGNAVFLYDSYINNPDWTCGDIWINRDGSLIFTRCSDSLNSTSLSSTDMIKFGSLDAQLIIDSMDFSADRTVLIPSINRFSANINDDYQSLVRIYFLADFTRQSQTLLPYFNVSGTLYPSKGRFVFVNNAGTRYYVILQADPASGLINDYGIVGFSM